MTYQIQLEQIDQIADRVETLLMRYEEVQRANTLLCDQIDILTLERDSLISRLSAARARAHALIERLPDSLEQTAEAMETAGPRAP